MGKSGFGDSPGLIEYGDDARCLGVHQAKLLN
jgi:hypothetical protein